MGCYMSFLNIFKKKKDLECAWRKYYTDDEVNIHIPNISMYDQIRNSAIKYPDCTALEYFGNKIVYKDFLKSVDMVSKAFLSYGIKKGSVVTLLLPNVPEVLYTLYGLNRIGAVANMVHPMSSLEEIKYSLVSTKSCYLVTLDMFYEKLVPIFNDALVKKTIFVSVGDSMNFIMRSGYKLKNIGKYKRYSRFDKKFISYRKFMRLGARYDGKINFRYGKDTPAVILHSGGTSGTPKNVVLQNRAFILASKQQKIALKRLSVGDSCLAIMPNFHGFGLSVLMHTPLSLGCYSILVPKFDSKKFDTLFKKTKPTCVLGVPTLFEALISYKNEDDLDLSFLKYVISGGDMLSKSLEDRVNMYLSEHNSSAVITQGYGLSEALAAVCLARDDINKNGSVGIPMPGNYIKIINPATRDTVAYNEVGEIVVNSKGLMMGYLNNESETNTVLQIHKDGHVWLHTGDIGYMDTDGFVFCTGRIKRMIISSGYNIYPSHIEEVIESHPAVLQCSVVGVKHPYKQEVPKAFIVLKDGFHGVMIKSDIKKFCQKNLAKYMVPYEFVYRKKLPKTKLGKIDFKTLESDIGSDDI